MNNKFPDLVESEWLHDHLNDSDLVILDGSMKKTVSCSNNDSSSRHIKGALFFDLENSFCDLTTNLPHTMPSPEKFATETKNLGINKNSKIVVYDNLGIYSSPRVWWMFKSMGHTNIGILNGGLPSWERLGYPVVDNCRISKINGDFQSNYQKEYFYSTNEVLGAIRDKNIQLIDVRSSSRFTGNTPEPRAGLRSGHIPSAINIPFESVLNNSQMVSIAELSSRFKQLFKSQQQKLVFNCGSGVTSCVVTFAAYLCGYNNLAVYDGSWTEWGARADLPIETI